MLDVYDLIKKYKHKCTEKQVRLYNDDFSRSICLTFTCLHEYPFFFYVFRFLPTFILLLIFHQLNTRVVSGLHFCPRLCACNDLDESGSLLITCSIPTIIDLEFSKFETNGTSELNLNCLSSRRSYLKDEMFQHLHSLSTITIRYCKFYFITKQTLYHVYGLYKLEHLTIDVATDLSIHEHSFICTPKLHTLVIVNSGMAGLPAGNAWIKAHRDN